MSDEIMVSISCTVYNHEKYLRQCLDGFIMQKTNFKFEVLVHDDASTDGSADIIREYEKKYPDIIKPIYQKENQYSKGVKISWTFQYPRAKGKYIALCEGDDFWIDPNKLQIQFDWMENHPEYTMCVHESYKNNLLTGEKTLVSNINSEREIRIEEILSGTRFSTNSFFAIKDVNDSMPKEFFLYGIGDIQFITYNTLQGKCYYFNKPMSEYNWGVVGSYTERVFLNKKNRCEHSKKLLTFLKIVDKYTNYKYHESIKKSIDRTEFNYHLFHGDFIKIKNKKFKQFYCDGKWNPQKEALINRFPWIKRKG